MPQIVVRRGYHRRAQKGIHLSAHHLFEPDLFKAAEKFTHDVCRLAEHELVVFTDHGFKVGFVVPAELAVKVVGQIVVDEAVSFAFEEGACNVGRHLFEVGLQGVGAG